MAILTPGERAQIEADHQSFMTSTCTIGAAVVLAYDPGTRTETEQITDPYYTGVCKVQSRDRNPAVVVAGGQDVTTTDVIITIPATVTSCQPGHVVQVTTSPDPANVRRFTITGVAGNDFLSARLLHCTDNQG